MFPALMMFMDHILSIPTDQYSPLCGYKYTFFMRAVQFVLLCGDIIRLWAERETGDSTSVALPLSHAC